MENNNLQDFFLHSLIKNKIYSAIFLTNGTRLKGHIKEFDLYTFTLELRGNTQLVYKHATATIIPWDPEIHEDKHEKPLISKR